MVLKRKTDAPTFEDLDTEVEQQEETVQEVETPEAVHVETETEAETETETVQTQTQTETANTKETTMTQETQTTAVATKPLTAVATASPAASNPTAPLEWVISQEEVAIFGPGTFPKVTANNAGTLEIDREDLDKAVIVRILSVNPRFAIVPGVDGDEASKLVRYSYNNHDVENEDMTVAEYIEHLKVLGYEKAEVKTYADLWVNILDSDVVDESEIVQVQLSPQSVGQWNALRTKMNFAQRRGAKFDYDDFRVKITGERKKAGNNTWGIMKFDAVV